MQEAQQNKSEKYKKWPYKGVVLWGLFGVFVLWLGSWILLAALFKDSDTMGVTGDAFGAINALFSGLAFAGLIYAIFLQRDELLAQREELEMTRDELRGQKEALNNQNETFNRQRFENTFFQMLNLYNQIADGIEWMEHSRVFKGSEAFRQIYRSFRSAYDRRVSNTGMSVNINNHIQLGGIYTDAYAEFYRNQEHLVGPYFRILDSVFSYVDKSDVHDKDFYINLIKSNLSEDELVLLSYHTIYSKFRGDFEKYAKTYKIFDQLQGTTKLINEKFDKEQIERASRN